MKIHVTGHMGLLGSAVCAAVKRRGHEYWTSNLDIVQAQPSSILGAVVINCAGLVKQRDCTAGDYMYINAVGPHRLAEACDEAGARLIHVSTDCVFERKGPHCECDAPDATDAYARSKRAGEVTRDPHLTIRTSFVGFGKRGLLASLDAGGEMHASQRLLWSGHTVETIADLLVTLAERTDIGGLLHIPGETQTRWELCNRLVKRYSLSTTLVRDDSYRADRRLESDRYGALGLPELMAFDAQLEQMERP